MREMAPLMSSSVDSWNTPETIVRMVVDVFDSIDLDPCSNANSIVGATKEFYSGGLDIDWRGRVYVNPPYGRGIKAWTDKCLESSRGGSAHVIGLLPARTDARWWQSSVPGAAAVCFWAGRLKFSGHHNSAPFPSALVLWSEAQEYKSRFSNVFANSGWLIK
jgi:hypothetical protein